MQFIPYLSFDGRCEEAFRFYAGLLGGTVGDLIRYAGSPAETYVPADWRDKVAHGVLRLGDSVLLGGDPPPSAYEAPKGFSVMLHYTDPAEAERIFRALAEGGSVRMAFEKTFWAERFGMATDRFGTPWMVNCEPDRPGI